MMPETTCIPCWLMARIEFEDRHGEILLLVDLLERIGLRRLDAAKDRLESGFAHHGEDFRRAGDVERRLAGEADRIAALLLPGDEMRQKFRDRLAVGDEIVVDEIDRADDAGIDQLVEFGDDLLGRLQPRHAAVEAGDVAELAFVGAAA